MLVLDTPTRQPEIQETNICAICFEEMDKTAVKVDNFHKYHQSCIQSWVNTGSNLCPVCRLPFSPQDIGLEKPPLVERIEQDPTLQYVYALGVIAALGSFMALVHYLGAEVDYVIRVLNYGP